MFYHFIGRIMKLASTNLNYILIVGAALQYTAVYFILFTFSTSELADMQTVLCNVRSC